MSNTKDIGKVRIILVGDSGVGKTCLTHLIAHNESLIRPGWTVGTNIEVKIHDYKEGSQQQQRYFVELFDIGGSLSHKNTRGVFYTPTHGIILVHDLTNRKSHEHLSEWLYEILNKDGKDTYKPGHGTNASSGEIDAFDLEQFLGSTQIPILVVGTKFDLTDEKRLPQIKQKSGGIAERCGAEEIWLNSCDSRSLAAGTTDSVKLGRFFDRVIEKTMNSRESMMYCNVDKRKHTSLSPNITQDSSALRNPLIVDQKTLAPKYYENVFPESNKNLLK